MEYSNTYVFGFAAAICIFCSVFVSGSAVTLKPIQKENQALDLQKNVVTVSGLLQEGESVSNLNAEEVESFFKGDSPQIKELFPKISKREAARFSETCKRIKH